MRKKNLKLELVGIDGKIYEFTITCLLSPIQKQCFLVKAAKLVHNNKIKSKTDTEKEILNRQIGIVENYK